MQISPIAAPAMAQGTLNSSVSPAAQEARQRAIDILTANTKATPPPSSQQEHPVRDPSHVSPEEMSAVRSPSRPGPQGTIEESSAPEVSSEPAKAPEDKQLSSQYAQLARREKALRSQALQLKQQNEAFAAREAAIKAKEAELQGNPNYIPKDKLSTDTLRVLEEAGISYEQLTEMALNGPSHEARQQQRVISELQAKLAKLEEGQTKGQQAFEEAQKNQYSQAIAQIKSEAKQLVSQGEQFELIHSMNQVDEVVELITKTFEADGVLLTVEEAAKAVEEHLEEEAMKLTRIQKIQKRMNLQGGATPQSQVSSTQQGGNQKQSQPAMKTLTNSVASSRPLTARERAVLAFKGELKS